MSTSQRVSTLILLRLQLEMSPPQLLELSVPQLELSIPQLELPSPPLLPVVLLTLIVHQSPFNFNFVAYPANAVTILVAAASRQCAASPASAQ